MLLTKSSRCLVPLAFSWSHAGVRYRVTPWPDVQLEQRYGEEWLPAEPSAAALAAASKSAPGAWRGFLEFVPAEVREFLALFRANRMTALRVAARCPDIVGVLTETPALTGFLSAHASLRGVGALRWHELNAVFERAGVYGVLEWLGLPASRQTIAILANLVTPDLMPELLEPLRKILWRPQGIFALAQLPPITERDVSDACALAA